MRHQYDLTQFTAEHVPGGVLYQIDAETVYAEPGCGLGRTIKRLGNAHPATARRNAENFLRRIACLDLLPKCCCACGLEVVGRSDHYCSSECSRRLGSRRPPKHFDWDALSVDEREAALAKVRDAHDERTLTGATAHKLMKWETPYMQQADGHMFLSGVEQADAIIRARGGIVPQRQDFWQYLHSYQTAQTLTESEAV